MLKPIIILTLYRRYNGFIKSINNIIKYSSEFKVEPDVIVVWAQPEKSMEFLIKQPIVKHIIKRDKLPYEGEKCGTTYPESHNIRLGLEYVKKNYNNCYALVQASDIFVKQSCYYEIDDIMQQGKDAAVAHWPNHMVSVGCYHTNIFAVSMDEHHWPPLCDYNEYDVLEWAWGKRLHNYMDWYKYNFARFNSGSFIHSHEIEAIPLQDSLNFTISGRKLSKKERIIKWLGNIKNYILRFLLDE